MFRGETMNSNPIRYLAFLSDDPGSLADFYARHFGLDELGRSNEGDVSLSDGFYNMTFLRRRGELNELRNDTGLHHVGVQVEDIGEVTRRYLQCMPDSVMVTEPGGLHFGERRFFDPECGTVSISQGSFGAPEKREVRTPRIAHIAFNALIPQRILEFYSLVFGFREISTSLGYRDRGRLNRFAGDGVTNLAIHPFYDDNVGHEARYGVNHFGFLVDDIEQKLDILSKEIEVASRPEERPFAEYRLFDPEGNKFDLSQAKGWEVDVEVWDKGA
jgi:catechol 2,3-dioxygenase-like lactoylglutathione lyase family enzyme